MINNKQKRQLSPYLQGRAATAALLISLLTPALSHAETESNIRFPNGEYTETTEDMQVKALGGQIKLKRTWQNSRWYINPAWSNLRFVADPLDKSVKVIDRAGTLYERSGETDLYISEQVFIRKTESGWRWYNRQGNWITYDTEGRMTGYGDANDVGARFELDAQGRRTAIYDHFNQLVYQFEYDSHERLVKATDRSGREVNYHWSGDRLVKVTDVMGNDWLYGYDNNGQLTQRTEPDGGTIKIAYAYSVKAPATALESGKVGGLVTMFKSQGVLASTKAAEKEVKIARIGKLTDKTGASTLWNIDYDRISKNYTVSEDDPLGKKTVSQYNAQGQLLSRAINGNLVTKVERDGKSVKKTIDERGLVTTVHYDGNGNVIKTIYPDGSSESTTYDHTLDRAIRFTNTIGTITDWRYDKKGNLLEQKEAVGKPEQRTTQYEYDNYGQTISVSAIDDDNIITTHNTYDLFGNVQTYQDGEGHSHQYQYTIDGQVSQYTTPSGNNWVYQYDKAGHLTAKITPLNHETHYTIDALGRTIEEKDPLGNKTAYQYNIVNQQWHISRIDALGQSNIYIYDAKMNLIKVLFSSGISQTFSYDEQSRLQHLTDAAGNRTSLEYGMNGSELAGQIVATHYPTYQETYRYNRRNQVIEVKQQIDESNASVTLMHYNNQRELVGITEPGNLTSLYEYNAFGNQISHVDANHAKTHQLYDGFNNLQSVTDANGNTHRYSYDKNGLLIQEQQPTGNTINYQYNQDGLLIKQEDANGNTTAYQYDATNRLIAKVMSIKGTDLPEQSVTYRYDNAGNLIEITQSGHVNSHFVYTVDTLGRRIKEEITYGIGSNAITQTLQYHYDAEGNLASLTYPDNTEVTFTHTNGLLTQATLANGKTVDWLNHQWNQPTKVKFPGSIQTVGYDPLMRPLTQQVNADNSLLLNRNYAYNSANNMAERQTEKGVFTYQYDRANRLIKAIPPTALQHTLPVEEYAYDNVGNRLGSSYQPGEFVYGTDNQLLKMGIGAEAVQFNYSPTGNLVEETKPKKTINYQYDVTDRLIAVTVDNKDIATYQYDPMGRRINKTVEGKTTWFIYSNEGLLAELNQSGKMIVAYGWIPDSMWGTKPLWLANIAEDQTLVNAQYHYIHTDHLGTPQIATNEQGEVTWQALSEAFGKTYPNESNKIVMNLRFPGQYYDKETDSHYNYFRDYNPAIGRYKQRDPIGLMGGVNVYSYANLASINTIDPLGLAVYKCKRPLNVDYIPTIVAEYGPHHTWLKTDTVEAGLGGDCPTPGQGCIDMPYVTEVYSKDHSGDSNGPNASCELVEKIDEECVNNELLDKRKRGTWNVINQCKMFVQNIEWKCSTFKFGPTEFYFPAF